eukprot:588086_1
MAVKQVATSNNDYLFAITMEQEDILDYYLNEPQHSINIVNDKMLSDQDIKSLLNQGIDPNEILELYPEITIEKLISMTCPLTTKQSNIIQTTTKTQSVNSDDQIHNLSCKK